MKKRTFYFENGRDMPRMYFVFKNVLITTNADME